MKCPTCGRVLPEGQDYCRMCRPKEWDGPYENDKEPESQGKVNWDIWNSEKESLPERPENSNDDVMLLERLEQPEVEKEKAVHNPALQRLPLAHPTPASPEEESEPAPQPVESQIVPVPAAEEVVLPRRPKGAERSAVSLSKGKVVLAAACVLVLFLIGVGTGWVQGGRQAAQTYEEQLASLQDDLRSAEEDAAEWEDTAGALQAERDQLAEEQEVLLAFSGALAGGDPTEAMELLEDNEDLMSGETLSGIRSNIYEKGEAAYLSGDMDEAENCFSALGDWSRSRDYLDLIGMKQNGVDQSDYDRLAEISDLPGASALLFSDEDMSLTYLKGEWRTETPDDYYFQVIENDEGGHTASYNLPSFDLEGYFYLEDGVYAVGAERESAFDYFCFTAAGRDEMEVYCYKDSQTYTLHRQ